MPDVFVSSPEKTTNPTPTKVSKAESEKTEERSHRHHRMSSFRFYPKDIDFESRSKDEKVVLLLRQHVAVNFNWILITIAMIFVPIAARAFGVFTSLPSGFELVITMAWYLVTMIFAFEKFLSWYFNVYIVTNERVIDVDFHNLIYKRVSDAALDNIQDVTYNMGGVTRTILNYGDVFIQTASEVSEFDFLAVPNPAKVVKIINDLIEKDEKK
jgi:hypothetical protein